MKYSITALVYLLVLLAGISIVLMLIVEYRQAKTLIENNKLLMKNTVIKTLVNNTSQNLSRYPTTTEEVEKNWRSLATDSLVRNKDKWLFPGRFAGKDNLQLSALWGIYEVDDISMISGFNNLPDGTKKRISSLIAIKKSLLENNNPQLNLIINEYFLLVENYQLSALEEVVSGLIFLQLGQVSQWNSELVKLYLLDGSNGLKSLSNYIFRQNKIFSKADMALSIDTILRLLENGNINTEWFKNSADELWKENLTISANSIKNYSIVQGKWIAVKTANDLTLFIPFSIELELNKVENVLKSQGILNKDDTLSFADLEYSELLKTIHQLSYEIDRPIWKKQIKQQYYFFIVKIILTLLFIGSLLSLMAFIFYRNRKKMEFVDLRENFINLVSHELRTPLASMRIMLETLQKRHNKNLSIMDYPNRIINEVDRLWLMIDNLLSMNQIKSGELELNIDNVNLSALVERALRKIMEQQTIGLKFENQLPKDCYCQVDPILFELIFINLFSNAIKYCAHSTVKIKMQLSNQKDKILFSDNGCGIRPSNWSKVFNDFYRETNCNRPGTGIGLSLCRQIMTIHHGKISIKDSNENGTIWVIDLPVDARRG